MTRRTHSYSQRPRTADARSSQVAVQRVAELLAHAARFRLLAAAFRYPDGAQREQTTKSFAEVSAARVLAASDDSFEAQLVSAAAEWARAEAATLEAEYVRLFHGAAPCALHETSYGDARRIAGRCAELSDIGGFYKAFGLKCSDDSPELPDHISTQLEFLGLLLIKQAYAHSRRWNEAAEVTADAERKFLESHLGRWAHCLDAAVTENQAPPFYARIAALVRYAVDRRCRDVGARPTPIDAARPADPAQEDCLECPMGR